MRLFVVGLSVIVIIASLLSGCGESRRSADMWPKMEKKQIFEVLDNYVKAVNDADADLLESLFWTEDPRFCEVENDQPMPFGKERFLEIADCIREHGRPGNNRQRFQDTVVYMLAPDAAYTVSLREEVNTEKTSRVTLVLVRKEGEWRILHAHFSCVPEDQSAMRVSVGDLNMAITHSLFFQPRMALQWIAHCRGNMPLAAGGGRVCGRGFRSICCGLEQRA